MYKLESLIEKIIKKQKEYWTDNDLAEILRNYSDYLLNGYTLKHEKLFLELAFLMNEGYINCRVEKYEYPFQEASDYKEEFEKFEAKLEDVERDILLQITACTGSLQEIYMKYIACKVLYQQGAREIEFKDRNYVLFAKETKVMVQTGDVGIKHLLNSFKDGLNEFIIMPYVNTPEGEMIILSRTEKLDEYVQNDKIKMKEEKKYFSKYKKSAAPKHSYNGSDAFQEYDLIEFLNEGKNVRGFAVLNMPAGIRGVEEAQLRLEKEWEFQHGIKKDSRKMLEEMIGVNRTKIIQMFSEDGYSESRVLIKVPKRNSKGVSYEFHAVNKESVLTKIPLNPEEVLESIVNTFREWNKLNLSLKLAEVGELKSNAAYDPSTNEILVSFENTINLCIQRFLDDGIHPIDTTKMLMAHEFGHADLEAAYLFDEEYYSIIERINELEKVIVTNWNSISSKTAGKEVLNETLKLLEEEGMLFTKYSEYELQGERDAFLYGLNYLPEYLKWDFQKDSYKTYLGYKSSNEKKYLERQNMKYTILDMLPTYEKRDNNEELNWLKLENLFNL